MTINDEERSAVAINPGMLRDEFIAFPGQLSDYGSRYAEMISAAAAAKEALKDIEADVYYELRARATESGQKMTEGALDNAVRRDKRVRMARELWLEAESRETRMKHKVMDPLYAKKEMLISIGAHQRAELSGDPMVRHAKNDVDELERKAFGR